MEHIIKILRDNNINNIVVEENLLNVNDSSIIKVLDVRSALYYATGIAATNKEKVAVICRGSNSSRSAFTGLTEAYYRSLPIIFITLGNELDYSNELNDIFNKHITLHSGDDFKNVSFKDFTYPVHIEISNYNFKNNNDRNIDFFNDLFSKTLNENHYFYQNGNSINDSKIKAKVVNGGLSGCVDGAISNVLGASLAKKHSRYIGFVSEEEFLHDINSLGNINVNDSLCFVLDNVQTKNVNMIVDYATSLEFKVLKIDYSLLSNNEKLKEFKDVLDSKIKTIIIFATDED